MKSHMQLMRSVLIDLGTRCCTSTTRDWKTIARRVEDEGMSFLTISLPRFSEDLQKGLSSGKVDSSLFVGYARSGHLPRFLGGFVSQVFDPKTGIILDAPSVDCIYAVRQICLLYSKINLPCSDARVAKAIAKYVECEQEVRDSDKRLEHSDLESFRRLALVTCGDVLGILDRKVFDGEIVPKHGPGSTADKLTGNGKFRQTVWPRRLESLFPFGEFAIPNWRYFSEVAPHVHYLEPGEEIPVKVITVPKTLKTPRIIAVEPTAMQYVQQGLMEVLVRSIEGDELLSNFIGFSDQVPNQELARKGSITGSLATLDLSEASDRVSNQLVLNLTCHFPYASEGIQACRSRKARVPGHGVVRLAKFASMGSALCFPLEAMVFLTIILLGIEQDYRRPISRKDLFSLVGKVRVYGDDLIVPVEHVHSVVEKLEAFGLRVNSDKSFWTGKFRESCGKEYFNGEDVSIVRVREVLPSHRKHVKGIVSTVSLRNQMYFAGNWAVAAHLDELLRGLIPFPVVSPTSPALGRCSHLGYETQKECRFLQKALVRAYVVTSVPPPDHLEGPFALLKVFLKRSAEPTVDEKHLERAGRPKAVNIKLGWVPAY